MLSSLFIDDSLSYIQGDSEKSTQKTTKTHVVVRYTLFFTAVLLPSKIEGRHTSGYFLFKTGIIYSYPNYSPSEQIDSSGYYRNEIEFWLPFFWITLYM